MTEENTTPTEEKKGAEATASEVAPAKEKVEQGEAAPAEKKDKNASIDRKAARRRPMRRDAQREPKEFEEAILQIDRVTRVTRGGRQLRFRISVVIGDKKGRVGFGIGKAEEVMVGIQKAVAAAKRNLFQVPIFNETIPHNVTGEFKSSKVLLLPAQMGKGVIAGGAVRKILELSGVKNVLSKIHGSRNRINTARATFDALEQLTNKKPRGMKEEEEKQEEQAPVVEQKEEEKKADSKKKEMPKKAPAKKAAPAKKKAAPKK